MGSPISGLIVEAVLKRFKDIVFQVFTLHFVCIDADKHFDFHMTLNITLPGIQLALDNEKRRRSNFLDDVAHLIPTGTLERTDNNREYTFVVVA